MMTLDEMKLAVCEKLHGHVTTYPLNLGKINWPTEGLQVCHEAEKLLGGIEALYYCYRLKQILNIVEEKLPATWKVNDTQVCLITAPCEQRLEALCHVWFPKKFNMNQTFTNEETE